LRAVAHRVNVSDGDIAMPDSVRIAATDGYALSGRLRGVDRTGPFVLINGATGVKQRYYSRFTEWLVGQGATTLTWDYRGIGESKPRRLDGFPGTMSDWGRHDFEGVLRFIKQEFPTRELVVVGHSVGGQLLGQAESNTLIRRAVTVGSQLGSWHLWPGLKKLAMAGLWFGLMPGVTHAVGRFPGRLGIGEDLPKHVALEWAKWGRSSNFFLDHGIKRDGFTVLQAPIVSYSFSDDDYAPKAAVDALHQLFTHAPLERRHLRPSAVGRAIGHFGFFRDQFESSLWNEVGPFVFGAHAVGDFVATRPSASSFSGAER
jgi:predicted alpha/beta hydrolase